MRLSHKIATSAIITAFGSTSSDKVVEIDEDLSRAGAAMLIVSKALNDLGTQTALGHISDLSDLTDQIEACRETLNEGEDPQYLYSAVDTGTVEAESYSALLATNFGPLSAFDPAVCSTQRSLAAQTAEALDNVYKILDAIETLDNGEMQIASELFFAAALLCTAAPGTTTLIGDIKKAA